MTDRRYMRRALVHAARSEGATSPNPMVGAVVVTPEGVVVGQGRHERAGEPHAEVHALADAGTRARGATLYVTLEPCCHTGRTGPCTERIIEAGITRVVAAVTDPNPAVRGAGFEVLRRHGIVVEVGECAAEATRLNRGFFEVHEHGRPMVVVKAAVSLDGKIARRAGERTTLSSSAAFRRTHLLRASLDALAVGVGTLLVDDPLLTVRECYRERPLLRAVFDRQLQTPPAARVFSTLPSGRVIILTSFQAVAAYPERVQALEAAGAVVEATGGTLAEALSALRVHEVSSVLVEGGARVHAALWEAGLVDRVHLVTAPVMLGEAGVPLFGGAAGWPARLVPVTASIVGRDTWMEADVHWTH
ncbi:MAG: bifunctional diaminohydroxyphosphoribosylaminopyrimidine deaminase/5-amino-6-(5-phosphoribosylamino)uracil reductase RibD [Vicinamibacterales bacterium]|nr:bifunctional diaminohydroxyphosphoribosylaminopyrimidine deaminase/5-amino-6-(5-phosphoribosylamino)uracil reductase RibD [Vicinamibacterales bacterium]